MEWKITNKISFKQRVFFAKVTAMLNILSALWLKIWILNFKQTFFKTQKTNKKSFISLFQVCLKSVWRDPNNMAAVPSSALIQG